MTELREKKPYLTLSSSSGETEEKIATVDQGSLHQISAASQLAEAPVAAAAEEEEDGDDDSTDDFEFTFVVRDPEAEPTITADEIFSNGRILPSYPVFDSNFLLSPVVETERSSSSSASSEADVAVGEYCTWSRRSAEQCKKSASTGSSRRWRLRDLMAGRSHSDGKEKFVFLAADDKTHNPNPNPNPNAQATSATKKGEKKGTRATELDLVTAHRLYYGKGNGEKVKGGRRSFLPYRQDLFGLLHGAGRIHHPF